MRQPRSSRSTNPSAKISSFGARAANRRIRSDPLDIRMLTARQFVHGGAPVRMARQDLQNRNLKTHGTPRDKTNFTTIACPGRPSIGQQRDFSTCLWPATTGSAHGLPLRSQAACGPAASVCSAQPRPGALWYGGVGTEPRRPRISLGPEDQSASDRAVPTLEITSRRPPSPLRASHRLPNQHSGAAADELISSDPHGARPLRKAAIAGPQESCKMP
jgi:hypothetical protein